MRRTRSAAASSSSAAMAAADSPPTSPGRADDTAARRDREAPGSGSSTRSRSDKGSPTKASSGPGNASSSVQRMGLRQSQRRCNAGPSLLQHVLQPMGRDFGAWSSRRTMRQTGAITGKSQTWSISRRREWRARVRVQPVPRTSLCGIGPRVEGASEPPPRKGTAPPTVAHETAVWATAVLQTTCVCSSA